MVSLPRHEVVEGKGISSPSSESLQERETMQWVIHNQNNLLKRLFQLVIVAMLLKRTIQYGKRNIRPEVEVRK